MVDEQQEEWQRQIKTAVKGNAFRFGSNRELRRLLDYLIPGEEVISILTGSRKDQRGRGIIVATSDRLLFLWDGWVFRETNDLPYSSLNSIEFKTGVFFGVLEAFSAGDSVAYNWVGRVSGGRFVKLVRQLSAENRRKHQVNSYSQEQVGDPITSGLRAMPPAPVTQAMPVLSPEEQKMAAVTSQMKQLKELYQGGFITEPEYNAKRQAMLDSI